MTKLLLGVAVMVALTYLGFGIDNFYKHRLLIATDLAGFLEYLTKEIGFLKTNLLDIMKAYAESCGQDFKKILAEAETALINGGRDSFKVTSAYLNKSEKEMFERLFKELTVVDYHSHKGILERYVAESESFTKLTKKQKKERGELCRKLFALFGVGLLIIFI